MRKSFVLTAVMAAVLSVSAQTAVVKSVGEAPGKHGVVRVEVTFDGPDVKDIKILA